MNLQGVPPTEGEGETMVTPWQLGLVDHKQINNKGKLGQKTQTTQQSTRDWLNNTRSEL